MFFSQLSELFPRVFLTAGVLSPPRLMSLYAVHQVLTFIIIVKKKQQKKQQNKAHWSMIVLISFLQEFQSILHSKTAITVIMDL